LRVTTGGISKLLCRRMV